MTRSVGDGAMPNFLLAGAMKAATTSVYRALATHPAIFMSPVKEPNYFALLHDKRKYLGPADNDNQRYWVNLERYRRLFAGAGSRPVVGEGSTLYLYHPEAATNIFEQVPEARIAVILRDPALRAYSHYCFNRQLGKENARSFGEALQLEDQRIAVGWGSDWHYRRRGLYKEQLSRYLSLFPREQILVTVYDDLRHDRTSFFSRLLAFLQIPDRFPTAVPTETFLNKTAAVRSQSLARFFLRVRTTLGPAWATPPLRLLRSTLRPFYAFNLRPLQPPPSHLLSRLRRSFTEETTWLEEHLERELPTWREEA